MLEHRCVHVGGWFGGFRAVCACRKEFTGQSEESAIDAYTLHVVEFVRVGPSPSRPEDRGAEAGEYSGVTGSEGVTAAVNPGFCPSCLKPEDYCICVVNTAARPSSPAPAGEGEVAWWSCALCGFSAAILCRECRSARHMPAPRGATCSERHHEYQTPVRPSSPTGETPCATCGGTGYVVVGSPTSAQHPEPCPDCEPPTGETAGQGVEEAWAAYDRVRLEYPGATEKSYGYGGGEIRLHRLRVEQAIRAEAEARATAAEAERDRLRADLAAAEANQDSLARVVDASGQLDQLTDENARLREALTLLREFTRLHGPVARVSADHDRDLLSKVNDLMARSNYLLNTGRALAGESTGAGEGERPPLKRGDGQQVTR